MLSGRPIRLLHRFLQCLEGQRGALSPIVSIGERGLGGSVCRLVGFDFTLVISREWDRSI